jgi:uncharacterized Zn finger protein
VRALVSGSEFYDVKVRIQPLAAARWKAVRRRALEDLNLWPSDS